MDGGAWVAGRAAAVTSAHMVPTSVLALWAVSIEMPRLVVLSPPGLGTRVHCRPFWKCAVQFWNFV